MHTKKFYTCKWDRPFKEILLKEENRDILQKILETTLKVKVYEIQNEKGEKYVDNFLLYEFNMDRMKEFWYSKEEKKIEEYKYLIMLDLGLEELEQIAKKDKLVKKYMEEIEKLNESPEFHIYMTEEEDRRKCFNTEVSLAKKEGIEKGIGQGSKQTALDIAKKLLPKLSLEEIQEITCLSIEEIENLKKKVEI